VKYWTTSLFASEIIGTANGLTAGWGNLGAGVSNMVMGTLVFPIIKHVVGDAEMAWRTACIVPAIAACIVGVVIYNVSDDTPKGNYFELKRHGSMQSVSICGSFWAACTNINTWIFFVQYGCCFGVQLTMNNAAAMYFKDEFGLSTESAAATASIFSWILLFARALGGAISDMANARYGMQGRIAVHTVFLVFEGAFVILFSYTNSLGSSIVVMIIFSLFVDAATGCSFAIVPSIDASCTGSIMGIVGAGGNVGAVIFGLFFRNMDYDSAFWYMGLSAAGSGLLSAFISIDGMGLFVVGKAADDDELLGDNTKSAKHKAVRTRRVEDEDDSAQ
jgi:MFS transporter, NNP family, nitrate/nitrite transporter